MIRRRIPSLSRRCRAAATDLSQRWRGSRNRSSTAESPAADVARELAVGQPVAALSIPAQPTYSDKQLLHNQRRRLAPAQAAPLPANPFPDASPREQIPARQAAPTWFSGRFFAWGALALLALVTGLAGLAYWKHAKSARVSTEGTTILADTPRPAVAPAFSPDGTRVAFRVDRDTGHAPGIYVSNLESGALLQNTSEASDGDPAWSPDGKRLAFVRSDPQGRAIYVVPANGTDARNLAALAGNSSRNDLDWSPDGKYIAYTQNDPDGSSPIAIISVETQATRVLTQPGKAQDWGPKYSPDGQTIAFVREHAADSTQDIVTVPAAGGKEQQLTLKSSRLQSPPAWTRDGQGILFARIQNGETRLWRVAASGGQGEIVVGVGAPSWHPSIPRSGGSLLAYQSVLGDSSVWRMNVSSSNESGSGSSGGGIGNTGSVVISAAGRNEGPQLSPNGRKLAFMSNRSGSMEIWISDPDGSYPLKLTNLDGCGSPRWSPDSGSLVFDSTRNGTPEIYVVHLQGGEPILLAESTADNYVPSWSHDGEWIYFSSNRGGQDHVWKVHPSGGEAVRVTEHEGFATQESADGKMLYFSSSRFPLPEIWQKPTAGGKESLVSPLLRPESWAGWTVTETGFYFLAPGGETTAVLEYFDTKAETIRLVARFTGSSFWLSSSNDGQTIWYNQQQEAQSVILVKRDFQ